MLPAGLAIFKQRKINASEFYAKEKTLIDLVLEFLALFQQNEKAWTYFTNLPPSYQKTAMRWVNTAKLHTTQLKRLQQLISDSEKEINRWKDNKYKK